MDTKGFLYLIPLFFFLFPAIADAIGESNRKIEKEYNARKAAERAAKRAAEKEAKKAARAAEKAATGPAPVQTKEEPAKVQEPAPLPTTCTLEQFAKHYTG